MTLGVVTFNDPTDYENFVAAWPMFAGLTYPQLNQCFIQAQVYLNNTQSSRVLQIEDRQPLLWMLTCHIAKLFYGTNDGNGNISGPSQIVGRVNTATEGSVSVGADMPGVTASSAWYMQTQWGAMYWQATAKYRTARYMRGQSGNAPRPVFPMVGWGGSGDVL
jgi:hypothetical protein